MQSPGIGFFYQRWSARYSGLYSEQSWKVQNYPLNFQAIVRNEPVTKFSRAKNSRCEIPPPPVSKSVLRLHWVNDPLESDLTQPLPTKTGETR